MYLRLKTGDKSHGCDKIHVEYLDSRNLYKCRNDTLQLKYGFSR